MSSYSLLLDVVIYALYATIFCNILLKHRYQCPNKCNTFDHLFGYCNIVGMNFKNQVTNNNNCHLSIYFVSNRFYITLACLSLFTYSLSTRCLVHNIRNFQSTVLTNRTYPRFKNATTNTRIAYNLVTHKYTNNVIYPQTVFGVV